MHDSQMQAIMNALSNIETRLSINTNSIDHLSEKLDELVNDVEDLKINRIDVLDDISRLNTEFESIAGAIDTIKSEQNDLATSLRDGVSNVKQMVDDTSMALSSVNDTISNDLNPSVSTLSLRIEQTTSAVGVCDELVEGVQGKISECKTNSTTLAESVESVAKSVNASFTSLTGQLANLKNLSGELSNKLEEIQKAENLLEESSSKLSEQVSNLTTHSSANVDRAVSLKETIELCSNMIPKIIEMQNSMITIWSRFIANSEGYNSIYELMVAIQGKIATSYENFIELATKATGTNYELNASLGNVTDTMKQVNNSITEINQAVILLKDFYPNLLESQHVCEHFAAVVPSQEKFIQLLETMTDKKISNLSASEKVEFGNMIARSVSSFCDMVNTTKAVKEGGSW